MAVVYSSQEFPRFDDGVGGTGLDADGPLVLPGGFSVPLIGSFRIPRNLDGTVRNAQNPFPVFSDGAGGSGFEFDGPLVFSDPVENLEIPSSGGFRVPRISSDSVQIQWSMRAWDTIGLSYVYWLSQTDPDPTGAQAPVSPGQLQDIVTLGTVPPQ